MKIKQLLTFFVSMSLFAPLAQAVTDTQDTPIVKSGTPRGGLPGTGGITGATIGLGATVLAVAVGAAAIGNSGHGNNPTTPAAPTGTN